jgi:hypothetical protein
VPKDGLVVAMPCSCAGKPKSRVEHNIVRWIHSMLNDGRNLTTQMGWMMRVSAGWLLVPLLLSVMADGILVRLSKEGLYIQCFTDDLALLIMGTFLSTVSELMQRASCLV